MLCLVQLVFPPNVRVDLTPWLGLLWIGSMEAEKITTVLGIPIPSTDPVFLAVVGVHVAFGLAAVIAGAVAMLSQKGCGRHSNLGTIYF